MNMALDKAVMKKLMQVDGVAAISEPLAGMGDELRVWLLTDTPEVRETVLTLIGNTYPHDKVIFRSGVPNFC
jgi:hypothetical protein